MRYALLIYADETHWQTRGPEEREQIFQEYMAFTAAIQKSGHHLAGEPLQPKATARTVRVRDGKTVATDGPYAETKEQLGGFYIVEARDLDEAISLAARVPGARWGAIEVRPLLEIPRS